MDIDAIEDGAVGMVSEMSTAVVAAARHVWSSLKKRATQGPDLIVTPVIVPSDFTFQTFADLFTIVHNDNDNDSNNSDSDSDDCCCDADTDSDGGSSRDGRHVDECSDGAGEKEEEEVVAAATAAGGRRDYWNSLRKQNAYVGRLTLGFSDAQAQRARVRELYDFFANPVLFENDHPHDGSLVEVESKFLASGWSMRVDAGDLFDSDTRFARFPPEASIEGYDRYFEVSVREEWTDAIDEEERYQKALIPINKGETIALPLKWNGFSYPVPRRAPYSGDVCGWQFEIGVFMQGNSYRSAAPSTPWDRYIDMDLSNFRRALPFLLRDYFAKDTVSLSQLETITRSFQQGREMRIRVCVQYKNGCEFMGVGYSEGWPASLNEFWVFRVFNPVRHGILEKAIKKLRKTGKTGKKGRDGDCEESKKQGEQEEAATTAAVRSETETPAGVSTIEFNSLYDLFRLSSAL